jgi:ubiquinone/menaquinone biosynthesis C-methylase UbiE
MATVFMRWLERKPETYERGIRLLTIGRLEALYAQVLDQIKPSDTVLEIGCGTGALTRRIAGIATRVEAIDISEAMLAKARSSLEEAGQLSRVALTRLDALALDTHFQTTRFDVVVSSLAFSELSGPAQEHVMRLSRTLLKPDGLLLLLDECQPKRGLDRLRYTLVRTPWKMITWLLTRTTTQPLKNVDKKLERAGFQIESRSALLGGALCLLQAVPSKSLDTEIHHSKLPRLNHRVNLLTLMRDLWALFFRVIPPYPKVDPGLYAIGEPVPDSPLLVTGNYDLTIRRLVKELDGLLDVWLLVVDTSGVNVWCGAGGGFLTAERVIGALHMSGINAWHRERRMVLPQLCANGVDGQEVREHTGWQVQWGPVRARDIQLYIEKDYVKDDDMRTVNFPLLERLEMVSATLGLYALMILIPVLIFWRESFFSVLIALLGMSYFYALTLPLIPGRDGLEKSLPLAGIGLIGLVIFSSLTQSLEAATFFRRGVGVVALSVFVAAEMQGMSPLMRGEQANWGWEAAIAVVLGGLYWLVPWLMGWNG